jgi:uncharacterized protein YraI
MSGRPDFQWALKVQTTAALCLAGVVAGAGLYFGNLGYIQAHHETALSHATGVVISTPCLNMRSGTSESTALIGCIPNSAAIPIECIAHGSAVTGPFGTETIWDRTIYKGKTGYVSDAWIYTGTNGAAAATC